MMKNKKIMRALLIGASMFALAGCSAWNDTDTKGERESKDTYVENGLTDPGKKDASNDNDSKNPPEENDANAIENMDGEEMIVASDLQGTVTEFSDNGCIINPVTSDNDGEAVVAAEGYEDESVKVTVKYGDDCTFQRAVLSITTGNATVSVAAKSDIKKKTSLLLYGNFDDKENFTATKAVIVRYEQEE